MCLLLSPACNVSVLARSPVLALLACTCGPFTTICDSRPFPTTIMRLPQGCNRASRSWSAACQGRLGGDYQHPRGAAGAKGASACQACIGCASSMHRASFRVAYAPPHTMPILPTPACATHLITVQAALSHRSLPMQISEHQASAASMPRLTHPARCLHALPVPPPSAQSWPTGHIGTP